MLSFVEVRPMESQPSVIYQKPSQSCNWCHGGLSESEPWWKTSSGDGLQEPGSQHLWRVRTFIWSSRKECYQIIHNDVQSQAIVQLLLSDERYNSRPMFLCYSAVRNYSIARCVDGGPVSASAQSELHGINRLQSKVLLYTKLCLLLGGTASRGASHSVVCPEGKEGIAAEQVTWNQTPQGWLWIVPLMLRQLKYSNVPGHALLQDWPTQLRWMLISVTLWTDEVVLRQWRVGEKIVLKASQKCATWAARTFLGFCLKL